MTLAPADTGPTVRPGLRLILTQLYWTARRDSKAVPHAMRALGRGLVLSLKLRWQRLRHPQRQLVALAVIEYMGDIVAAEPIARHARMKFPDARIVWIVRKPFQQLANAFAHVDQTLVVGCMTEWLVLWSLGGFDVVWDMHINGHACVVCDVSFVRTSNSETITFENYRTYPSILSTQCKIAGIDQLDESPHIESDAATLEHIDALELPPRFIVVHATASHADRNWTDGGWHALVDHLCQTYEGHVIEVGLTPQVIRTAGPKSRNLCGVLSILQTVEVLRRAELFIGVDSGPAHLANAVAVPAVLLMGDMQAFKNYTVHSGRFATPQWATIVRPDGPLLNLDAETVIEAVDQRLAPGVHALARPG